MDPSKVDTVSSGLPWTVKRFSCRWTVARAVDRRDFDAAPAAVPATSARAARVGRNGGDMAPAGLRRTAPGAGSSGCSRIDELPAHIGLDHAEWASRTSRSATASTASRPWPTDPSSRAGVVEHNVVRVDQRQPDPLDQHSKHRSIVGHAAGEGAVIRKARRIVHGMAVRRASPGCRREDRRPGAVGDGEDRVRALRGDGRADHAGWT